MNKTVSIEFTVEELNIIMSALGELPLKISSALATKINKEATEQLGSQEQ